MRPSTNALVANDLLAAGHTLLRLLEHVALPVRQVEKLQRRQWRLPTARVFGGQWQGVYEARPQVGRHQFEDLPAPSEGGS